MRKPFGGSHANSALTYGCEMETGMAGFRLWPVAARAKTFGTAMMFGRATK